MSRISRFFKQKNSKALITYLTVGYPDFYTSLRAVMTMVDHGADIIELGIPYSDPLADGVTIQKASQQALHNNINVDKCLALAGQVRVRSDIPLVFMSYLNPILRYGAGRFCKEASRNGVDGLIIPDMPPEEASVLEPFTQEYSLDLIYLLSPDSPVERIRAIAQKSMGFIYLVTESGVTGARDVLPSTLPAFIKRVRCETKKPLCAGFGISDSSHTEVVAKIADGVIIGSKIISLIEKDDTMSDLGRFVRENKKQVVKAVNFPNDF